MGFGHTGARENTPIIKPLSLDAPEFRIFLEGCRARTGLELVAAPSGWRYLKILFPGLARVFCWVDRATGDVLRAGSRPGPGTAPRGNIFQPDGGLDCIGPEGPRKLPDPGPSGPGPAGKLPRGKRQKPAPVEVPALGGTGHPGRDCRLVSGAGSYAVNEDPRFSECFKGLAKREEAPAPGPEAVKKVQPGPPFTQEDELFLKGMGILVRP